MHWTQALRARGFTEEEINQGVKGWKNGKDWRVGEGRNLPTWEDVEDVFMKRGLTERESEQKGRSDMEKADQKEEKRERWRLENGKDQRVKYEKKKPVEVRRRENFWGSPEDKYAGVPYKGYICKRCGGSGMFMTCTVYSPCTQLLYFHTYQVLTILSRSSSSSLSHESRPILG